MSVDEETTVDMAVAEVASAEMDANGSSVDETPTANPIASEMTDLDVPTAGTHASRRQGLLESSAFNKALIVACALAWGFSFFVMKDVTELFPVFWLLLVRFGISSAIMAVVFHKAIFANLNLSVVKTGVLLGVLYGAGYIFQTYGIVFTTPGKNAFLTGVYCVLVPFCAWALGHGRPRRVSLIAAFVSLVGAGFVVLDNGLPLNVGDALTLVGSVFYALEMVVVSSEGRGKDVWALTWLRGSSSSRRRLLLRSTRSTTSPPWSSLPSCARSGRSRFSTMPSRRSTRRAVLSSRRSRARAAWRSPSRLVMRA